MKDRSWIVLTTASLSMLLSAATTPASSADLVSPDGRITVTVSVKERLEPWPTGRRLYYSVARDGRTLVADSALGLDFADQVPLARDLVIEDD